MGHGGAAQGQALASLGLHEDLILLVFTMVERDDSDSAMAPFWRSLPDVLITGMSQHTHCGLLLCYC